MYLRNDLIFFFCLSSYEERKNPPAQPRSGSYKSVRMLFSLHLRNLPYNLITNKELKRSIHETLLFLLNNIPFCNRATPWLFCFA